MKKLLPAYAFGLVLTLAALHETASLQANTPKKQTKKQLTKKQKKGNFAKLLKLVTSADHNAIQQHLIANVKDITSYINERDEKDKPILITALMHDHGAKTLRLLLVSNADVNATDPLTNDTPLHIAIEQIKIPEMELLLKRGANINAKNKYEKTPLDIATELNNVAFMKFLTLAAGQNANEKTISDAHMRAQKLDYKNMMRILQKYLEYKKGTLNHMQFKKYLDETSFR